MKEFKVNNIYLPSIHVGMEVLMEAKNHQGKPTGNLFRGKISRIGRVYFYVTREGCEAIEYVFKLENGQNVDVWGYILYRSESAYHNRLEREALVGCIQDYFVHGWHRGGKETLSLDALQKINAILLEEGVIESSQQTIPHLSTTN